MYTITRWIINALVLMVIPYYVRGVEIGNFLTALIASLALALVNSVIRPIILLLTLPLNVLTLGLFTFVINGLMFWFVASFVKGFDISGFWPAFWAALVYSIFSIVINYFIGPKEERI